MSWQPIETAPRDGRRIIVTRRYGPDSGPCYPALDIVRWMPSRHKSLESHPWKSDSGSHVSADAFLHWMPAPDFPDDYATEGEAVYRRWADELHARLAADPNWFTLRE